MGEAISVADILVPEQRSRALDPAYALILSESIGRDGLKHLIGVRRTPNAKRKFTLVWGLHRLEAVRLLGLSAIDASIVKANAEDALRMEVEENLIRYDLTVLDRAEAVLQLRTLWEAEHGPIDPNGGRPQKLDQVEPVSEESQIGSFVQSAADRIGISQPAIKRLSMIAQKLTPKTKAFLTGHADADNQSALLKAAKVAPEWQKRAIDLMRAEPELGLGAAIDRASPFSPAVKDPQMKRYHRTRDSFYQMLPAKRRDLLVELGVPEDIATKVSRRQPKSDGGDS